MLGFVPYLELRLCRQLEDISSLNHNDQVVISHCDQVQDYSRSFAYSRKIEIHLGTRSECFFDSTVWTKVEELYLYGGGGLTTFYHNSNRLPLTVKRCALVGHFSSSVDFTVTSNHVLKQLRLSHNNSITSLEGYGLERVAVVECQGMNLLSLQGLGGGRNCKIVIIDCHQIQDFSPLNHVPLVEIAYCEGFTNAYQLRSVRHLSLWFDGRKVSFPKDSMDPNPYRAIYSLFIPRGNCLHNLEGLEAIPHLILGFDAYQLMEKFLEEGKRFKNQRIVLDHDLGKVTVVQLLDLHRYMDDSYDYFNQLPKKWSWTIRKNSEI